MLCAALFGIAGCSSSSPTVATPKAWDAKSLAVITKLTTAVAAAAPGQCADAVPLPLTYLSTARKLGLRPLPLAIEDCTAFGSIQEFSAVSKNTERDALIENRASVLCARSKKLRVGLPGLRWAVGDHWAAQSSSEDASRKLSKVLGASYRVTPCPGAGTIDWDAAAGQRAQVLAAQLASAGLGCADVALTDHDVVSHDPALVPYGLPSAESQCNAAGATVLIEVFGAGATAKQADFIAFRGKSRLCGASGGAIVNGPEWSILVATETAAKQIARALGGKVTSPGCV